MANKLLYKLRNVGTRHAAYANVTRAEALELIIEDSAWEVFLAQIQVENMTIPGHQNIKTTEHYRPQLPEIISGKSKRWHLWEARIYRHSLVLNYLDREAKGQRRQTTALKCYLEWPAELEMTIQAATGIPSYYKITHLAPDERYDYLTVKYDSADPDKTNVDSYEEGPKRR